MVIGTTSFIDALWFHFRVCFFPYRLPLTVGIFCAPSADWPFNWTDETSRPSRFSFQFRQTVSSCVIFPIPPDWIETKVPSRPPDGQTSRNRSNETPVDMATDRYTHTHFKISTRRVWLNKSQSLSSLKTTFWTRKSPPTVLTKCR